MDLDNQDKTIIQEEVSLYEKTHEAIRKALSQKAKELDHDENLARRLTSEMVAESREEEKQALSSDEKVAHGLAMLRLKASNQLVELDKQPYFARVVYHENGRDVEFKLGVGSFPEQRIIDWRKGPLSKLYYNFEEGEEYDEDIAGTERHGLIRMKRAYRGQYNHLSQIEHRDWSLVKHNNQWHKNKKHTTKPFSITDKQKIRELLKQHQDLDLQHVGSEDGYLSQILALITPEQFSLISKDTTHPVVIQGSAGTGKTTVAMHRLAWLLFEGNSTIQAKNCLVVVFHKPLVEYMKNVLPSLGIDSVTITTYLDWARDLIESTLNTKLVFARQPTPDEVKNLKSSMATLELCQTFAKEHPSLAADAALFAFYDKLAKNPGTTARCADFLRWQVEHRVVDIFDLSLLIHCLEENQKHFQAKKHPIRLDHLIIDEAQDFTLPEILALTSFLPEKHQMTLAGDLGQKIFDHREFGSWEDLIRQLGFSATEVLNLNVAFRSTYQIYELAEFVRDPNAKEKPLNLLPKFGAEPKAIKAHSFTEAVLLTKNWIEEQLNLNQNLRGAILCRSDDEAKRLFHHLSRENTQGIRFADAQHFKFTPGIMITAIKNVKGLEFHAVCVFNPSDQNYRVFSDVERNLLYVGMTRALLKLDFIGYDDWTTLLPESLEKTDLTLLPENSQDENSASDDPFLHTNSDSDEFSDDEMH